MHLYNVVNYNHIRIKSMGRKNNKFTQISNIYSQFSEKNRKNLVRTAQSLLEIQKESEAMLAPPPLNCIGKVYTKAKGA